MFTYQDGRGMPIKFMQEKESVNRQKERMAAAAKTTSTTTAIWNNLIAWVETRGNGCGDDDGMVHRSLELRSGADDDDENWNRGVFSTLPIARGSVLIRLPVDAVLHGRNMPMQYRTVDHPAGNNGCHNVVRPASPWLRCLAAYLQQAAAISSRTTASSDIDATMPNVYKKNDMSSYMASLPDSYETIWHWGDAELDEFLAGTTSLSPPTAVAASGECASTSSWKVDCVALRQSYGTQIRPYLRHCGILVAPSFPDDDDDDDDDIDEIEFQRFAKACQALSTRGFHMETATAAAAAAAAAAASTPQRGDDDDYYSGPYMLPVMDLLNHHPDSVTSSHKTCTRLQQLVDGSFCMVAERDIAAGEEILHSYGDHLCSSQFLASFGFVPDYAIQRAAAGLAVSNIINNNNDPSVSCCCFPTSPVALSKTNDIWESCWRVIDSGFPQQLAAAMRENPNMDDDEAWTMTVDRSRKADYVPPDIMLQLLGVQPARQQQQLPATATAAELAAEQSSSLPSLLTDELVTAACVPFLPKCAYSGITARTLLDRSILQDYFLGKLVGTALLQAVQRKLSTFRPIPETTLLRLLQLNAADDVAAKNAMLLSCRNDDVRLLQHLRLLIRQQTDDCKTDASSSSSSTVAKAMRQERQRLAYGLTVRIEEKKTLEALRRDVVALLTSLDDGDDYEIAICVLDESGSKRQKAFK